MLKKSLYKIIGLPSTWVDSTFTVVDSMRSKLLNMLKGLPDKPVKLYVGGSIAGLVNMLVELRGISSVTGIDYKEYFNNTFDSNKGNIKIPYNTVVVIYDVASEKAVNTSYSTQVLTGLLKTVEANGCHAFVQSDISYNRFLEKYGITFKNVLKLPKQEEVDLNI